MSESSSGVNTSSGSFPKTLSSPGSNLNDTSISVPVACRRKETPQQSCDSGILSPWFTPVLSPSPADSRPQESGSSADGSSVAPFGRPLTSAGGSWQLSTPTSSSPLQATSSGTGQIFRRNVGGSQRQRALPSDKFKFRTWHELEGNNIKGTQLHCPRVRTGPSPEDLFFKDRGRVSPVRKEKQNEGALDQRLLENWENCLEVNLSYQGLGDTYQLENFYKILRRLIRVEKLQLVDNFLTDLRSIRLPRCKELNLNKNHLTSFKQLPKIPQIQHLSLTENNIKTLRGLYELGATPIESLTLKRNPCEFQDKYRSKVFSSLPNLKTLDGIPKLPADCAPVDSPINSRMCTIS